MRLRYLHYFLAVAEERNYTRAAARVHIEPSPLSRAIREMETDLGAALIQIRQGHLHLTRAGEVFRDEARRLLVFLESARSRVQSAARGHGQLRIGLADRLAQPPLIELLARCREEEPQTEIRLLEMNVGEMAAALDDGRLDAGFTIHPEPGEALRKEAVWRDRLALVLPRFHPLLSLASIPLREIARYPLLLFHPESCPGAHDLVRRRLLDIPSPSPRIAGYVPGHEAMLMLAAAGYGVGVGLASQLALYRHPKVIVRRLASVPAMETFLVIPERPLPDELRRFVARAQQTGRATSRRQAQIQRFFGANEPQMSPIS